MHELYFAVFLFCLYRLGVYNEDDFAALVNKVF